VGPSSNCFVSGWIKVSKVTDWRQPLTLTFTERTGRQPVLFFNDLKSLNNVAASSSPDKEAIKLVSQFEDIKSGSVSIPDDFPITAIEPTMEAVSRERFYIMPITRAVEMFEGVKFLEVASIDPGSWELPADAEAAEDDPWAEDSGEESEEDFWGDE
jgi:serine/threonine-protein kinase PpkA